MLRLALLFTVLCLASGCTLLGPSSFSDSPVRPAENTPDQFVLADGTSLAESVTKRECRSPLIDPRDQTRLTLAASLYPHGDYTVEGSRYGVGPRERLRVDCSTGAPVGIVPRR